MSLDVPAWVRAVVVAGPPAYLADELAERVGEQLAAVVRATAPQSPRRLAHSSGRPRCARFECHHASIRLSGFLVRHYHQFTRLAPAAREPQPPAGDGEAVQDNQV